MDATAAYQESRFRKMLLVSGVIHALVVGIFVVGVTGKQARLSIPKSMTPVDIMWARPISHSMDAPKDKLPGPMVKPRAAPEAKPAAPKIVVKKVKSSTQTPKSPTPLPITKEELQRQQLMEEAIAGIEEELKLNPTPKPDNFPSSSEASPLTGLMGIGGTDATGHPACIAYKLKVKTTIENNLVWLQHGGLQSEISIRIGRDGEIFDSKLTKTSSNAPFDNATLRAVRKSRLPAPPAECAQIFMEQEIGIIFTR